MKPTPPTPKRLPVSEFHEDIIDDAVKKEVDRMIDDAAPASLPDFIKDRRLEAYSELCRAIMELRDMLFEKQGEMLRVVIPQKWDEFDDFDFGEEQLMLDDLKMKLNEIQTATLLLEKGEK